MRAAGAFLREDPEATLTVVGAPPRGGEGHLAELRAAVDSSVVGERIFLVGHRPDAAAAMADFDLLAVPSLAEPFGTVAAEAAAAGVPVVATATGGLTEVVLDGETGLLVPSGDAEALAAAVAGLLRDPGRLAGLGRRAHAEAARFAPERYAAVRQYTEQPVRQGVLERPWDRLIGGIVLGSEAFARPMVSR